jgi:pantetheine-phosphate adenylyltransferase
MHTAIYPGSFDPVTRGHLDIIERAAKTTDKLIVAVLNNGAKNSLFSVEERVKMLEEETKDIPNVEIRSFNGLLVEFAAQCDAHVIIRGLRAITDFEYELQMAQTNRVLNHNIDTLFLTADLKYSYVSSSTVKEVARFGGDISSFVTHNIANYVMKKFTIHSESK